MYADAFGAPDSYKMDIFTNLCVVHTVLVDLFFVLCYLICIVCCVDCVMLHCVHLVAGAPTAAAQRRSVWSTI